MGSFVEINDTLQINTEQGVPSEILDFEKHKENMLDYKKIEETIFEFHGKSEIRIFHTPPCRCFLAENTGSDWCYWGHILIQSISHDYINKTTSGTYKITKIFNFNEMKQARNILGVK